MDEKYKKGDYKNGKGFLVENTPEGPLYKVEGVWVSPFTYRQAEILAKKWGVSERIVLSKMAEQYVAKSSTIDDRLSHYKTDVLPILIENAKKEKQALAQKAAENVFITAEGANDG